TFADTRERGTRIEWRTGMARSARGSSRLRAADRVCAAGYEGRQGREDGREARQATRSAREGDRTEGDARPGGTQKAGPRSCAAQFGTESAAARRVQGFVCRAGRQGRRRGS